MSDGPAKEVTDEVIPDKVTEVADSVAEPENEPEPEPKHEPKDPDWKGPVGVLENRVAELGELVSGLTARVPAPNLETADEPKDTTPVRKPWTSRGFKRRNVVGE